MAFRKKNAGLADKAVEILERERPMTLRQLFYRLVSAGVIANAPKEYKRLGGVATRLREEGVVPFAWIVDHVRSTLKPSSWSGLADFGDAVRRSYRKDFWSGLDHCVEVFVEKDAVAGAIQPVTHEYDVRLHVCRGYASLSFVGEIAEQWKRIGKPVFAYYVGDFDPSGFDIERDLAEKLERYSGREFRSVDDDPGPNAFNWERLAVVGEDFDDHNLIRLPLKTKKGGAYSDNRAAGFIREHGQDCAEVDALPPTELRFRVREAVEGHIDQEHWARLQNAERAEQATLEAFVKGWPAGS
jgi:hypothetical protein